LIRKYELTACMLGSLKCVLGRQGTIRNDATLQLAEEAVWRTIRSKYRVINSVRSTGNFKMLTAYYLNVHYTSTFQNTYEINTLSSVM